ncbi:hypothetical protein COO60DRAFT_1534614, partial [Scenedesmus sp. NREL 46B-D3]
CVRVMHVCMFMRGVCAWGAWGEVHRRSFDQHGCPVLPDALGGVISQPGRPGIYCTGSGVAPLQEFSRAGVCALHEGLLPLSACTCIRLTARLCGEREQRAACNAVGTLQDGGSSHAAFVVPPNAAPAAPA